MVSSETSSNDLAAAPKISYPTREPMHKPLKCVVPAVDPKIMKTKDFGRKEGSVS
jgi:hypothetical protein